MTRLITLLLLLVALPAVAQDDENKAMKCPDSWKKWFDMGKKAQQSYFHCDYTSQTCERGFFISTGTRVFELLASDRKTVIGRYLCNARRREICFDFDAGISQMQTPNGPMTMGDDERSCEPWAD